MRLYADYFVPKDIIALTAITRSRKNRTCLVKMHHHHGPRNCRKTGPDVKKEEYIWQSSIVNEILNSKAITSHPFVGK